MSVSYIKSTKNKDKLCFENYLYVKDRTVEEKSYWKCENIKICKARVHVVDDKIVKYVNEHNHPPDKAKVLADGVINELKRKAVETNNSPSELINSISTGIHISVAAKLPSVTQLKKTANRMRASEEDFPATPTTVQDIDLPEQFRRSLGNDNFLLFDSGKESAITVNLV